MPDTTMTLAGCHTPDGEQASCHRSGCEESQPQYALPSSSTSTPDSTTTSTSSSPSYIWATSVNAPAPTPTVPAPPADGPPQVVHSYVPHCKQNFSWDCGLACVQMVLQAAGHAHVDYRLLRQLCTTTSIWTVDLAHLLRRFGLAVTFCTLVLGPNPAYAHEAFYMEHMADDERRVRTLFVEAGRAGIALQQRSVGAEELQSWLLSGSCLVVVLVDKRRLDPWLAAADACLPTLTLCGLGDMGLGGYAGHYVLLVGFDRASGEYIVRDPAAASSELRLGAAALDAARRSFGTDEDLLVVGLPYSARGVPGGQGHVGVSQAEAQGGGPEAQAQGHAALPQAQGRVGHVGVPHMAPPRAQAQGHGALPHGQGCDGSAQGHAGAMPGHGNGASVLPLGRGQGQGGLPYGVGHGRSPHGHGGELLPQGHGGPLRADGSGSQVAAGLHRPGQGLHVGEGGGGEGGNGGRQCQQRQPLLCRGSEAAGELSEQLGQPMLLEHRQQHPELDAQLGGGAPASLPRAPPAYRGHGRQALPSQGPQLPCPVQGGPQQDPAPQLETASLHAEQHHREHRRQQPQHPVPQPHGDGPCEAREAQGLALAPLLAARQPPDLPPSSQAPPALGYRLQPRTAAQAAGLAAAGGAACECG